MPIVKRSCIDALKERANIYDVVSTYVTLRKTGSTWRGLSPFNEEKTPSFYVLPEKNIFKCFSSGYAGDVFRFLEIKEGLNFQEAVEMLAERFNVTLEYEQGGSSAKTFSLRKELLAINEQACAFFHQCFLAENEQGKWIRNYWEQERRFSLSTAKEFQIGLASPQGMLLLDFLRKKEFSVEALRQSGLFYTSKEQDSISRWKPRFEGRLMIPIRDIQGRVIAFTARQLAITPNTDPAKEAKYVNTPETPLFQKSHILFGLDRARQHVNEESSFILVEGQLDVIRCWEKGIVTAVAPQGTAVTDNQLTLIRRYSRKLDCLLDGDSAGQKAALRLLPMALKAGLEIHFLSLRPGEDPDLLLLNQGAEGLMRLAKDPESPMQFALKVLLPKEKRNSPSAKSAALEHLYEILQACSSAVVQESYLSEISLLAQIDRQAIQQDFGQFQRKSRKREINTKKEGEQKNRSEKLTTAEFELLFLVLHYENIAQSLASVLNADWIDTHSLYGKLLIRLLAELEAHPGQKLANTLDELLETEEEKNCIYTILSKDPPFEEPLKCANVCLRTLYIKYINNRKHQIEAEINQIGNKETLRTLQQERIALRQSLQNLPQLTRNSEFSQSHA